MSSELTFSRWIRERRNELGITQENLADRLGFSPAMLRKLESGDRRPSGQIASLLASHFGIPDDEREAFIAFARTGRGAPRPGDAQPEGGTGLTPWRGVYVRRTNVPSALTELIGREQEEQTARDLLLHPKTRLLTLTGTAGIGKTRLALQLASGLMEHFDGGIYFVDLAPLVDPDAVLQAVAHTLGLQEEHGPSAMSLETVLLEYVRERRILLVLDNFEHLLDAASSVVTLLQASSWTKVLATSREALHVRGERRFPVPPLTIPDLEHLPALDVLVHYPSVELFLARAQDVAPDFAITQASAPDVAALCARLEGLPLAIELAASRANLLSPAEMTQALGSRLRLLTAGARDVPARHRTLRAAIDWSYRLLGPDEQYLFRCLGVFVGGFTSEAVEFVFQNLPGREDQAFSTLDLLSSLVNKSLVRVENGTGKHAEHTQTRFGLLEAIREYSMEQLSHSSDGDEPRSRHAEYFLSLADRAEAHFTGPQSSEWGAQQIAWMDRLETDLDNMRVALDWFEQQVAAETWIAPPGEVETQQFCNLEKGLRLGADLRRIWLGRGYLTEGLQRLRALLVLVPAPVPAELPGLRTAYAMALLVSARLFSQMEERDVAPIRPLLEEAGRILTELGHTHLAATRLLVLGRLASVQGDYQAARLYFGECLQAFRELGNVWGTAAALEELGSIELDEGNFATSNLMLEESLAGYRAVGESFGISSALSALGLEAYRQGDFDTARERLGESLQIRREIGARSQIGDALVLLGLATAHRGDYQQAASLFGEGLKLARQTGGRFGIYRALSAFGTLEALQGNGERAALLFGAVETLRNGEQIRLSAWREAELESHVAVVRASLTKVAWDSAWARGSSMVLEDVIASLLPAEGAKPSALPF